MFYAALILQIVTLFYHQITTRFDFFPFNGARFSSVKERQQEAQINGIVMLLPIILLFTHNHAAEWAAFAVMCMVIFGALFSWWVPYATGFALYKMPNNESWSDVYQRIYAKTIIILPRPKDKRKTAPNVEHMILHTLIVSTAVVTLLVALHK